MLGMRSVFLAWLFVFAWIDRKSMQIPLFPVAVMSVSGLIIYIHLQPFSVLQLVGGVAVGGAVLVAAQVSKERIGVGDGYLLCATGIYLGLWKNLILLWNALAFCSIVSICLLLAGACDRKKELPFIPFLLVASLPLLWEVQE